jgi:tRNA/tmRNA/rRNA uracil-C5-methylase (TrmA/RlmC/RlmD family)
MSREPSACTHRPPCPGCPRLFEPGFPERAKASLWELARRAGIAPPSLMLGAATGFRHRARLSVRGRSRSPKIGIFQTDSHRIVDIPGCLVHHPLINQIAAAIKLGIKATNTRPYADDPHAGDLRSIQIAIERSSQRAQLTLIGNCADPAPLRPLLEYLAIHLENELHSLWWNGNPARTNTILGPHWEHLSGPVALREEIAGASVFFPPGAFGQSNLDLADLVVEDIRRAIPDDAKVAEFYAGCGSIGLGLVSRSRHFAFNEMGEASRHGLSLGIEQLDPALQSRIELHPGAAGDATALLEGADVAIADPPRKGLDRELLNALCENPPERFVYLSCGLDSFLRDCATLLDADKLDANKLKLSALSSYALVRHSEHVENLAIFDRI